MFEKLSPQWWRRLRSLPNGQAAADYIRYEPYGKDPDGNIIKCGYCGWLFQEQPIGWFTTFGECERRLRI